MVYVQEAKLWKSPIFETQAWLLLHDQLYFFWEQPNILGRGEQQVATILCFLK